MNLFFLILFFLKQTLGILGIFLFSYLAPSTVLITSLVTISHFVNDIHINLKFLCLHLHASLLLLLMISNLMLINTIFIIWTLGLLIIKWIILKLLLTQDSFLSSCSSWFHYLILLWIWLSTIWIRLRLLLLLRLNFCLFDCLLMNGCMIMNICLLNLPSYWILFWFAL